MSDVHDGSTRSFRPGAWFGIFGEHATVLLPPTEKARVAALWELVDDGAGFDVVLDALIADGLRELPGFVLVSERDAETKVVLRGAARATFVTDGESVELEGSAATTWVERSLHGVTRMLVQVAEDGDDGAADGPDLTIGGGLVRLSRLDEPAHIPDGPRLIDGEAAPVGDNAPGEADVAPADDGAGAEDAPADDVSSMVEPTSLEEPAGEPGDEPDDEPVDDDDSWPFAYAAPPPADGPDEPPVDLPTEAVDIPATWDPPAPDGTPAPDGARAVATLAFSSGASVEVDRAVLIGRAPESRRSDSGEEPRLVAVPSPHQEISSTHLEVRPGSGDEDGSAVVTDLGSTNGTVVVQPGQPPEDLRPGTPVRLVPGAVIDLGDGVTIQVSNP